MRAAVTCEVCRHHQKMERDLTQPEQFYVVCHECESVLKVEVSNSDLGSPAASKKLDWRKGGMA